MNKIFSIFKPLNRLFRLDSSNSLNLFLTSVLIGNPAAANIIYTEYSNNKITNNDYVKLIYNSGFITPLFIFSLFPNNIFYSITLLISHYLSYFLTCIFTNKLVENKFSLNITTSNTKYTLSISQIFYKACEICLSIASIMLFANLIIASLSQLGINFFYISPIELSTGIFDIINSKLNKKIILTIVSMLLSFNGFCIHLQIFSQIKDIKYKTFLLIRIIQSLISGTITFIILSL